MTFGEDFIIPSLNFFYFQASYPFERYDKISYYYAKFRPEVFNYWTCFIEN